MDRLNFLASLIGSLVWPVTAIIIVLLIRKPLQKLMPLLQRVKYKEFELEFERRVEEVRDEINRELPKEIQSFLPIPEFETLAKLADISPRAAVLESFRTIEHSALESARRLGKEDFPTKTLTFQAIRFLEQIDSLDPNIIRLLRELRELRNAAAHASSFALTKESALEYAASAASVSRYLDSVNLKN